jgi:hypothetical protein
MLGAMIDRSDAFCPSEPTLRESSPDEDLLNPSDFDPPER